MSRPLLRSVILDATIAVRFQLPFSLLSLFSPFRFFLAPFALCFRLWLALPFSFGICLHLLAFCDSLGLGILLDRAHIFLTAPVRIALWGYRLLWLVEHVWVLLL